MGSGIRTVGSGITAIGSGITDHGIGISSFLGFRHQAVPYLWDQGRILVTPLESRIRNLRTKMEGCPILTTCSSRESGDSSGPTGTSSTSGEVVNVRRFSETT